MTGKSIMDQVRENLAKKYSCPLHQFDEPEGGARLGQYYCCRNCGWKTKITHIGDYAMGYKAAGGDPDFIMKGLILSGMPHGLKVPKALEWARRTPKEVAK